MKIETSVWNWNIRIVFVAAALFMVSTVVAADGPTWKSTDSSIALCEGGETLWQFNYGDDLTKPYFHPVAPKGSAPLTAKSPPDHPWHHAMWFCWKFLNDVNYWEEDRKTGKSAGITDWSHVKIVRNEDFSADITMDLAYHTPGEKPILTENRSVRVSAPNKAGNYRMDWTLTFTAQSEDVVFDRTPLPGEEGGKSYGGYAGLSVRFNEKLSDWQVADSEGEIKEVAERIRVKSRAVDFNGVLDKKPVGIAILDHPDNLNAPTPWYIILSEKGPMRYFSPAVIQQAKHTLKAGESFTLRYRVLVHHGRYDSKRLTKEVDRFEKAKKK